MVHRLNEFGRALTGRGSFLKKQEISEEFWALKDINFKIMQGEKVGIIGRNGAGKSTLLKILSRITEPTTGSAMIRGRVASLLEVGTGFHPDLSGRENIYLNGAILGMSRREIRTKFDEIVDFAEVEQFLDTPVKWYSSGMYVRLAFAVAAHLDPEVLIVDEVLSVGDAQFQKKCMGKMDDVGKEGRTVIFVSHSMATISRLCSRTLLLNKGELVADGDTDDVIRKYLLGDIEKKLDFLYENSTVKDMHIRRVSLEPQNKNRSLNIPYTDPIEIEIEYEVNNPIFNCVVWLALETSDGTMVFTTSDYDTHQDLLGVREKGRYVTQVKIPPCWLNVGEYTVIVGLVQNHPLIVYDRESTIIFNIEEIGTPGSVIKDGVRRGVLQPILPWTMPKLIN